MKEQNVSELDKLILKYQLLTLTTEELENLYQTPELHYIFLQAIKKILLEEQEFLLVDKQLERKILDLIQEIRKTSTEKELKQEVTWTIIKINEQSKKEEKDFEDYFKRNISIRFLDSNVAKDFIRLCYKEYSLNPYELLKYFELFDYHYLLLLKKHPIKISSKENTLFLSSTNYYLTNIGSFFDEEKKTSVLQAIDMIEQKSLKSLIKSTRKKLINN